MRNFWIALMILALFPALVPVRADGADRGFKRDKKGGMMEALDLDKDQLARMRELRNAMKRKMIEQTSKVELAQLDFQEELYKDKPDAERLNRLIDQISSAKAKIIGDRLTMRVEMIKILTAEQKQKMLERMGSKMLEYGKGKGRGKGFGERRDRR
ncbi:hypothetical protein MNBD_NITROSPINAE03-57 [hydrothermal vent metagenome]|uniref:Periplasmic heavy metal sensor n=1 Tax=hydrothermal vent metagenome TaxID=652676 RepID=A0A3B1CZH7_9ZZZZ